MTEINLQIEGMHCGACIRRVTQALQSVPAATVEEVRLGAARVQLNEGADAQQLLACLNKAGFRAQLEK
jgi:copper chaperone